MDYLNFDLRVGSSDNQTYPVTVIQSPAGEASAALQLQFDDPAFQQSLQTLEICAARVEQHANRASSKSLRVGP